MQAMLILDQDYVVQQLRFEVDEGFGCTTSSDGSVLDILLTDLWTVIPPLVSMIVYYRQSVSGGRCLRSADVCFYFSQGDSIALPPKPERHALFREQ